MKPITSTLTLSVIRYHWLIHRIFNAGIPGLQIRITKSRDWEVVPRLQTLVLVSRLKNVLTNTMTVITKLYIRHALQNCPSYLSFKFLVIIIRTSRECRNAELQRRFLLTDRRKNQSFQDQKTTSLINTCTILMPI